MKKVFSLALSALLLNVLLTAAQAQPRVTPIAAAQLKKAIAAQKGKVVLVNFWATWCQPCVKEMPELVRLQKQYGARGVRVLLVSADEAYQRPAVTSFLNRQKWSAPSYIVAGNPQTFVEQFDPKLDGAFALPRTYIYNRKGQQVRAFSGDKTFAEFEKLVKPLL